MAVVIDHPAVRTAPVTDVPRSFGWLLGLLASGLLFNSAIGPLGVDVVDYPITDTLRNQLIGLEVVTLLLVVPWCAVAAVRALRGHADAPLLAFGPAAYSAYMFVQYVLGPEYDDYRAVTLLHLGLVTLSAGLALWAWSLSRTTRLPARPRRVEVRHGVVLFALAAFVLLRYAGALAGAVGSASIPDEFAASRTFYWSIYLLDLGVVVPATVVGAVALLRGHDLGRRALYAITGWFALVPPSVASMAAVMLLNDDPNGSAPTVVLLSVVSVLFGAYAVVVYRPLWGLTRSPGRHDHQPSVRSA